ncbi:protein pxr1-like [Limosa lapponica baueri]|uniref:Protein pxr1-like n=1 Tax=Limosa lapponica baueri TaxID=1758121 RepID=A0A2I0UDE9_LIMLA|nr:protein pxr1-like [Limosa lapponica baueri]
MYLRRDRKTLCSSIQKRGVRIHDSNNSADTKVSEEGEGRGVPGAGAEISLQPMVKTMVGQAVTLQPMEVNSRADIHLQSTVSYGRDPMLKQKKTVRSPLHEEKEAAEMSDELTTVPILQPPVLLR